MIELTTVINLQLIIFTLFICGFILRKLNIIGSGARKGLTDLLIYLILPCNIIHSFEIKLTKQMLMCGMQVLIIASVIQILSYIMGLFMYNMADDRKKKVLRYATMCSNAGFMGNPVIEGLYASEGLVLASVYLIPLRIFMWSAGLSCFTSTSAKEVVKKLLKHPCIIAVWIGFILMFSGLRPPYFLDKSITYCSNCTLPVSMIVIGSILAEVDFKRIFKPLTFYYAFIRLILIPAITLLLCYVFGTDAMTAGVCVVLAGMPAGSTTAILAEKYDGDSKYASECIFVTTILSVVTLLIESWVIQFFF